MGPAFFLVAVFSLFRLDSGVGFVAPAHTCGADVEPWQPPQEGATGLGIHGSGSPLRSICSLGLADMISGLWLPERTRDSEGLHNQGPQQELMAIT